MAVTATPIYPQTINPTVARIQNSDSTNKVTLYTAGTNGCRISNIMVTSTETSSAKSLAFYITSSGTDYLIGTVNIPANSGFTTSAATVFPIATTQFVSLDVDANGNRYFTLKSGQVLKASVAVAMTSGKFMDFYIGAGEY